MNAKTTFLGRIAFALCLAAALCLLPSLRPVAAGESDSAASQRSFALEVGGRWADSEGDRTFVKPYDPLGSNAVLGLDFFSADRKSGILDFEAGFQDEDDWDVKLYYNRGGRLSLEGRAQGFFHALQHVPLPPTSVTPAPGFGPATVIPGDEDPDAAFFSTFNEYSGRFKVRAPAYPAHLSGGARLYRREGPSQLAFLDRSCGTSVCHINSRTRDLDEETREYDIGFDAHAGPVDVVYSRSFLFYEDDAPDPVDRFGLQFPNAFLRMNRPPGEYVHDVNNDVKSYTDVVKVNTNLTNRAVLALNYIRGNNENEETDLQREFQRFVASIGFTPGRAKFFSARYTYYERETAGVSPDVAGIRETIEDAVEPGSKEHIGELTYRVTPRSGLHLHAHVGYSSIERDDTDSSGLPGSTSAWFVDVDGRFRLSPAVELEAELMGEWTSDPGFATDFTTRYQYGLGLVWTPSSVFNLLARYHGFRGENDDEEALQSGYVHLGEARPGFVRESDGNSFLAAATWLPAERLSTSLSYSFSDNDLEQDLIFGSADDPGFGFFSENTPWDSRYHIANLDLSWAATNQLTLTLGYLFIAGEESYTPTFAAGRDLGTFSDVEFIKNVLSLEGEYSFTEFSSFTLGGFWADYDDGENDDLDGRAGSVLATVKKRW